MTLGEKIKDARLRLGMTQEQLAEKLCVSRQAITKWESGAGIPDISNIKALSGLLDVSIDFLVDDTKEINQVLVKESINLEEYKKEGKIRCSQDAVVYDKFPDSEIIPLMAEKKVTKGQRIFDNILGIATDAPFGTIDLFNELAGIHDHYYLVNAKSRHYLVLVTKDILEIQELKYKVEDKKFSIGDMKFKKLGFTVEK